MTAALAWLAAEWPNVRPNLEASVLWAIPTWALIVGHHVSLRRHIARHGRRG